MYVFRQYVCVMYENISAWLTVDYLMAYKVLPTPSHIYFTRKAPPWLRS